jgi:hypothetical protein
MMSRPTLSGDVTTHQLHASHDPHRIEIFIGDATTPCVTQHAAPNHRPFIHPLLAPDGSTVLTEDAPAHHPWQHGLSAGLNDVNGAGFWTEGLHEPHRKIDGSFHPLPLEAPQVKGDRAAWLVRCEWRSITGEVLLVETQQWAMRAASPAYFLQFTWTLTAQADLTFGQYDYGGLFLRMPFHKARGGEALNSAGQRNADAEAQRARWCAVSMPVSDAGNWAGVALFDHPSNMQFPTPWRVDHELGVGPSPCIAGAWHLQAGNARRFTHGVLPFMGRADASMIEHHWKEFNTR